VIKGKKETFFEYPALPFFRMSSHKNFLFNLLNDPHPATMAHFPRSPELLSAATSRLLIVDMQERFAPVIPDFPLLVAGCRCLVQGARLLSIPVSCTEQYPQGLGSTVPELAELIPHRQDKLRFSCAECLEWSSEGGVPDGRHQVVLAGIETHVCISQTAMDLMTAGFDVYVVADLTRSQQSVHHEYALRRMADSGVRLITSQMALFEWCEVAGTPEFKRISHLVREKERNFPAR